MRRLIALVCILLTPCVAAEAQASFKLGWIGPLTGNAAVLGIDSVEAVRMAVDEANASAGLNGRRVEMIVEDDQYVTSRTIAAYRRLVHQDGVRVIFIITYSGLMALAPQAQRDNVLLIDPLDCNEEIAALPQNIFCVAQMTEQIGRLNAEHAVRHGLWPAAILYYENDAFMGTVAEATVRRFSELGHPAVMIEGYDSKDADFRTLLTKIRRLGVKSIFFYGYDELGTGMRQAREIVLGSQFYSTVTVNSPGYRAASGNSSDGTFVSVWQAPHGPAWKSFMESFKARTGRSPALEISTIPSFDAAKLLLAGFDKINNGPAGERQISELRDFLYKVKDYRGLSGSITIGPDGATRTLMVETNIYQNGTLMPVQ